MTGSSTTLARRRFDQAMGQIKVDIHSAGVGFAAATEIDPSMADAWLGRIIAGDDSVSTVRQLYSCRSRLHRETNRLGVHLAAPVKAGPYLSISVIEPSHVGLAMAGALIDAGDYAEAEELLDDSDLLDSWENYQWRQYLRAYLMFAAQRWSDVMAVSAQDLPAEAIVMSAVTAAISVLAAHAAAHLGQARVALEWTDRVHVRAVQTNPDCRRGDHLDATTCSLDPTAFPLINADLCYVQGMAHRQLGDEDQAQIWLSRATIRGVLLDAAKRALAEPLLQLLVTDEATIQTRADKWDVSTESTAQERAEANDHERRDELLVEGRALLDNQVGLAEVKRAVRELEDQIEVRALRLEAGLPVASHTNHMLLVGPPGTGKTTTAEALGKIYAGLGIVRHPEIIEVKRADFCGEHIGSSGPKTNDLIARSLGRILFMDEFYSLVERHQDGRPDMIGMEAVNQLLVALEVHRFDFCFIGAGYEKEIDEFLTVNPGLAGRFNRRLRFRSYTPAELVEIGIRYGTPRATVLHPDAVQVLTSACSVLQQYVAADGSSGIDVMHNGRFVRNVIERAERSRDSRLASQHRSDKGSVTVEDLQVLRPGDVLAAATAACAEKHIDIRP